MAKTTSNLAEFQARAEQGAITVRPIGGRVLLPGEYNFAENPEVRYEEREIRDTKNTYLQLEIKSSKGWVDLSTLMKRTKSANEGSALDYINDWIQQYSDVVELAGALAGHTLVVSNNKVPTYSTYKDGQTCDAYVNGVAYRASLLNAAPVAPASKQ